MADLDSFFAKKKDKKKKTVVKVDDVGSLLERKAKKQEEREREEHEDGQPRNGDDDRSQGEDSEWLDYETNTNNRVDGLRIKDMVLEEAEEEAPEIVEGEEKEVVKEVTKTWGTIETAQTAPELIPTANEYAAAKSSRYIAPSLRGGGSTGGGKIDLTNQEMFPTFAAAEQIEKHKKDEVKTTAWSTAGAPPSRPGAYVPPRTDAWSSGRPSAREKDDALAAVRAMSATAGPTPVRAPHPPEPVLTHKSANAYVPPHLRNQS